MKRAFCIIFAILILVSGCTPVSEEEIPHENKDTIKAVWIYYSELEMLDSRGGTEKSFTDKINTMFDNCVRWGINTVFLQVRPCADSFYESDIFPWSYYLTGKQGKAVSYDPLEICVNLAHEKGLSLHAWINPFRISFDDDVSKLSSAHPAIAWIKSKTSDVVFVNDGIYFSPASMNAQKLVLDGVREIVENYDVDGIHIDDYFYPSTGDNVDSVYYNEYKTNGGKSGLTKWRLDTVSAFIGQMYTTVKSENADCVFSISPAGNINNNYEQQFADVKLWCSRRGYADWIIPQLYYGFENDKLSFDKAISQWEKLNTIGAVKMIYGVGAYKVNDSDDEWDAGSGIIDKQLEIIRETEDSYGVAFFSYSSLADSGRSAEFRNIPSFEIPSEQ